MGKSNLYLCAYNQYYNKQVKRESTLEDYMDYVVYSTEEYQLSNSAFVPGDGIDTQHVVNTPDAAYDYLIVTDEEGNIASRWFVIQADYIRGQGIRVSAQYRLTLRRDLIVDYYDAVVSAATYIEKASLLSTENPLIYNSEGFQCNQIKTKETLLKDVTNTPWIVCYFDKTGPVEEGNRVISTTTQSALASYEYSMSALQALLNKKLYGAIQGDVSATAKGNFSSTVQSTGQTTLYTYDIGSNNTYSVPLDYIDMNIKFSDISIVRPENFIKEYANKWAQHFEETGDAATYKSYFYSYAGETNNSSLLITLNRMEGKVIKDTDSDTYYRITLERNLNDNLSVALPVNSELYNLSSAAMQAIGGTVLTTGTNGFAMNANIASAIITKIEVVSGANVSMTLGTVDTRVKTEDAPYDIFCMPYGSVAYGLRDDWATEYTEEGITMNVAQKIATVCGAFLYDIQLLPYCPCMDYWSYTNYRFDINATGIVNDTQLQVIRNEKDGIMSFGFWCKKASFRAEVANFNSIKVPTDPVEFKVANECDKYRLCSPNYNGVFEFTATKNRGILGFEINCTYKPQQPYIHVNPIFNGLYGKDFNDSRGLICGGDFSLPRVNDAWVDYQIQNKSLYDAFDRQIENMETTYKYNKEQTKIAGIINAMSAGIAGGGAAAAITGKSGASASTMGIASVGVGLTAAAGSAIGLSKDLYYMQKLQDEAISYANDQFGYSLQNIQALPNTLTRVSAFDINNKLYPFLEYYTCTDIEKDALRNKLKYNGMTVMTIGTIADYIQENNPTFIQGQIIRLNNLVEDYHIALTIANEVHRGIYI